MKYYSRADVEKERKHGNVTSNGVVFDWWHVNINGAGFALIREPFHTDEDMQKAERLIRGDRDVITLSHAKVQPVKFRVTVTSNVDEFEPRSIGTCRDALAGLLPPSLR